MASLQAVRRSGASMHDRLNGHEVVEMMRSHTCCHRSACLGIRKKAESFTWPIKYSYT